MSLPENRYEGKPFLKLLDCYVLWAIGELPEEKARSLDEMTPKFRSTFGKEGDWQQIISAVMEFPPNMQSLVRERWAKNTEIAHKNGVTLTPQQFAEMFVDSSLV